MIRSILTLRAAPLGRDLLLQHYLNNDVLSRSRDFGWLGGEVAVDTEDASALSVISLWTDIASYRAWRDSPRREKVLTEMRHLLDGTSGTTQLLEVSTLR